VTKENQLQVGLLVCGAVLRALIHTHPNKEALSIDLQERFAALEAAMTSGDEGLGDQELSHLKIAMDAFLWPLHH
jgi:hypothetical protein